jgi:hypothetical protein
MNQLKCGDRVGVRYNGGTYSPGIVVALCAGMAYVLFDVGVDAGIAAGYLRSYVPPGVLPDNLIGRRGCHFYYEDSLVWKRLDETPTNYVGKCITCDDRNEFCAPNLPDGRWQCYSCRQNPYRRKSLAVQNAP